MRVHDILSAKGSAVLTLPSSASVTDLLAVLADHRVGAVVVVDDDRVVGIASERDVVRHFRQGASPDDPIATMMTADVVTCSPDDDTRALAETMTAGRFRHVPVVVDGRLRGVVSIGDVVKIRLDELQAERDHLEHYLTS
ncbi:MULTISPECIES: CBS domain-containing protein [Aestuariimicrobium]|uniref:CBS domain-containing protein n=1 Tax=Aestuariimicrobium TaxID=396388 RepID=UPI0003B39E56|nr:MULTISPECIES: CBS domain-containing protein [Aestuariimicrobium]